MTTARQTFAQRLKAARLLRGYSSARVMARQLDIPENRYTRYERAETEPDIDTIIRISKVLDLGLDTLFGLKDDFSRRGDESGSLARAGHEAANGTVSQGAGGSAGEGASGRSRRPEMTLGGGGRTETDVAVDQPMRKR